MKLDKKKRKNKVKKNDNEKFKMIFKSFVITRVILLALLIISDLLLSNYSLSDYKHVFDLFDNEHYLSIASDGYEYLYQYAFFPLTPLLIRYLGKVGFLLLNQILVLCSGYLLCMISEKTLKKENGYFTALLYFVSPISAFTCMFYTEALFVFLTLLTFYLYKTNKNYLVLGITLGLSVATRSLGSALFFTIFIFMLINVIKRKEKFKNLLLTFIPATIISCLYPLFLYEKTGSFIYFVTAQKYWLKVKTSIFTILFDSAKYIFTDINLFNIIDYVVLVFLLGYTIAYVIKHRKDSDYYDLFVYLIFTFVAVCSTMKADKQALTSIYRYIFGCFPIYLIIKKSYVSFGILTFISVFLTCFLLLGIYFF